MCRLQTYKRILRLDHHQRRHYCMGTRVVALLGWRATTFQQPMQKALVREKPDMPNQQPFANESDKEDTPPTAQVNTVDLKHRAVVLKPKLPCRHSTPPRQQRHTSHSKSQVPLLSCNDPHTAPPPPSFALQSEIILSHTPPPHSSNKAGSSHVLLTVRFEVCGAAAAGAAAPTSCWWLSSLLLLLHPLPLKLLCALPFRMLLLAMYSISGTFLLW